ncbi:MAG: flagellar basal body P-ring protein FlgI [Planctomycetes bacterium]|nr:flagellar basal body P-ring protein FlgI [Planctomycetota bacterium]
MHRPKLTTRTTTAAALLAALLAAPSAARAVNVRDLCHLQGARENQLMAVSLVVGLDGTGDGKSLETARSLAYLMQQFGHDAATLRDVSPANVALVMVTATVPACGAREGVKLDVRVSSLNGAKSLSGGRLVQCQMLGPMATPVVYALAAGDVVLEDPDNPTAGIVKGGAVMERDVLSEVVAGGRITLVLDSDHATWAVASSIARIINEAEAPLGGPLARAEGPSHVVVRVPAAETHDPADFIARVLDLPVLMPDLKARIVINRRTGTIVITGDVQIDPVTFTQRGLTIQVVDPQLPPTPAAPRVSTERFGLLDPAGRAGRTTARELTDAFNQLQVPIDDQIAVIWAIKRAGLLHAEVVEE